MIALLLQEWEQNGRRDSIDQIFEKLQRRICVITGFYLKEKYCVERMLVIYTAQKPKQGNVLLASEPRQFPDKLLDNCKQIKLNTTITLRSRSERDGRISINNVRRKELGMEGAQGLLKGSIGFRLLRYNDHHCQECSRTSAEIEALHEMRASRYFPGIIFDSNGTCSVCNDFKLLNIGISLLQI